MKPSKQTYKYIKANSILNASADEYRFTREEYYSLYNFYVTYSMCGNQSAKKRSFGEYGWSTENILNTDLGTSLSKIINMNRNVNFVFTDKDDLDIQFAAKGLLDGGLTDLDYERAVIAKTSAPNNYLKLFYRIRDGLAHGKYQLRFSSANEKMIVIQDDDGYNVTARIVLKLKTLLDFIQIVDKNRII